MPVDFSILWSGSAWQPIHLSFFRSPINCRVSCNAPSFLPYLALSRDAAGKSFSCWMLTLAVLTAAVSIAPIVSWSNYISEFLARNAGDNPSLQGLVILDLSSSTFHCPAHNIAASPLHYLYRRIPNNLHPRSTYSYAHNALALDSILSTSNNFIFPNAQHDQWSRPQPSVIEKPIKSPRK